MSAAVSEPVPIFKLAHRYLLYDVNVVTYLRREHNIGGVLIGTLPQASQQNVFLGLPLELMPEEARVLMEKGTAYIVDDVKEHKRNFLGSGLSAEEKKGFQDTLKMQGLGAAQDAMKKSSDRKKTALKKQSTDNWNDIPDDMLAPTSRQSKKNSNSRKEPEQVQYKGFEDEVLFALPANSFPTNPIGTGNVSSPSVIAPEPFGVTPTTSVPPLRAPRPVEEKLRALPNVPKSYPLYKHLHEKGYFLAPGLRFGCQYMAYPGDPLRFHSHFLCNGMDWDQEFDLFDLVGGGRLGTGVKKGFLIGGVEGKEELRDDKNPKSANVRAFCVEWAGM